MKCPIDVEKKVAEMRQELHPDALVEDAYVIRGSFVPPGTCWLEDT